MSEHNKFDLMPCECGRQLRHRTAEQECRTCRADKQAAANRAALEWAMVGEKPVNWESALALSAGAHKCDEAEYRASRQRAGKDD
jgi:hypothetical protein